MSMVNKLSSHDEKGLTLSPNALRVLEKRYLTRDEAGRITETPEQLFRRVALTIAAADRLYGADEAEVVKTAMRFEALMKSLRFLPNTPTLMNAGKPHAHPQYSACFVVPVEDDMQSIGNAVTAAMMIHKTGGGTGFSFSRLRPKGDLVRSSGGVASGPVSFMRIFDAATEQVKQGSTRRGANMGIL
jgi:ribonucleoside-diphosphate reductase alpha chain